MLHLLAALVLILCHRTEADEACHYGTAAGRYVKGRFPAWHSFDKSCQLENLWLRYEEAGKGQAVLGVHEIGATPETRPVRVLLFGDSVEQAVVTDVCERLLEKDFASILTIKVCASLPTN